MQDKTPQTTPTAMAGIIWSAMPCIASCPPFGVVSVQVRVDVDAAHVGEPSHLLVDALGHRLTIQKGEDRQNDA